MTFDFDTPMLADRLELCLPEHYSCISCESAPGFQVVKTMQFPLGLGSRV